MGFLPLLRQGLSPSGRELVGPVCMCSTAGLDVCPVAGVTVLISPPCQQGSACNVIIQSPSRGGNTSGAVHDLLKYLHEGTWCQGKVVGGSVHFWNPTWVNHFEKYLRVFRNICKIAKSKHFLQLEGTQKAYVICQRRNFWPLSPLEQQIPRLLNCLYCSVIYL